MDTAEGTDPTVVSEGTAEGEPVSDKQTVINNELNELRKGLDELKGQNKQILNERDRIVSDYQSRIGKMATANEQRIQQAREEERGKLKEYVPEDVMQQQQANDLKEYANRAYYQNQELIQMNELKDAALQAGIPFSRLDRTSTAAMRQSIQNYQLELTRTSAEREISTRVDAAVAASDKRIKEEVEKSVRSELGIEHPDSQDTGNTTVVPKGELEKIEAERVVAKKKRDGTALARLARREKHLRNVGAIT